MAQVYASGNVDNDLVNETNAAVGRMASDMAELVAAQKTAGVLLDQQQAGLDATEKNLDVAQDNLNDGTSELEEARALRRGCCGCCGVPACFKPCACGENNDKCNCIVQ